MSVAYDIEQVIPHRGAMRLIDRLLTFDAESVVAELRVPADALFGDAAGVPAWVGVEYMAQTVAAWAGCRSRARGAEPSIGFLLGTRRYQAETPHFPAGALLRVEARCELLGDNGLGMFACRILQDDAVLATANISVFEPPDAAAYLESSEG
ncbi:MAG TPA: hotdog family protein [Stenotrophomonas sp.]|nr:hotdog family protein [Stenotrophomonas sp.]